MPKQGFAVEIDDLELAEAVQKKAFKNGYQWGGSIFDENEVRDRSIGDGLGFHPSGNLDGSSVTVFVKSDNTKFIGNLSDNWNKIVDLIEGNNFTFKGYQTEYHHISDVVEIGCRDFRFNNIMNLRELMKEMAISRITYGDGIKITRKELDELINWVKYQ